MANSSIANAHTQLITRLLANLPAGYTTASVKFPNRPFATPDNGKWIRPTVIITDSQNNTADGTCELSNGLFIIDIFFPIGESPSTYRIEAEALKLAYKSESFNDVNCQSVTITDNPDDVFYSLQITIEFYIEGA